MKKAVIFDMDGVLSDTERTRFLIFKEIFKKRGLEIDDTDYSKSLGKKTNIFLKELGFEESDILEIHKQKRSIMFKNPEKYIIEFPYLTECLDDLKDKGYTLAVASSSSKDTVNLILQTLGIKDYFQIIISSDDVDNLKPHPEMYNLCVANLKMNSDECVIIEDSAVGIEAAKSAGIYCIAITNTSSKQELSQADCIIESLNQIADKLEAL